MMVTSTISPSLKRGLEFLGAWPNMPYATVRRLTYISSILIMQYFQYLYVFAHCKPDEWQGLVDSLPPTLNYSLTLVKLVTLWKNRRVFHDMLAAMDTDWRECANVEQYLQVMTTKASMSHFCSNTMLSVYAMLGVFYFLGCYAFGIVYTEEGNNDTVRPFPIKMMFPFEAERSPVYELIVVILFLHFMLNVYTVATLNALMFTLILHASGQIDIICQGFETTSEKIPRCGFPGHTIRMLVNKHNNLISFSAKLDKFFSFMALMQVLGNTLVICCLGLLVMTVCIAIFVEVQGDPFRNSFHLSDRLMKQYVNKTGLGLGKTAFAYSGVMMEIFIFCFAGEYLSLKSKLLTDAAYDSPWYNMSPNQIKNMLLVIMKSQKVLTITAGGMMNLSLQTFASIMKASASYASVLHAMY